MFDDSFRRVVLEAARENRELILGYPKLCQAAQSKFLDHASALCYCMCYQRMHVESLCEIFSHGLLDMFFAPLIIDIGAGPGSTALALAERFVSLRRQPISLRYYAIDRSSAMEYIARNYLKDRSLFSAVGVHWVTSIGAVREEQNLEALNAFAESADVVVIAMSYVLKQRDVDLEFVRGCAKLTVACGRRLSIPTFVVMQDVSAPPYDRHDEYYAVLGLAGFGINRPEFRFTQPHRRVDFKGDASMTVSAI